MDLNAPSLTGLRVLDLSRVLAGPYCTQILADHGADVWKVEHPTGGDDTRAFGPPFVGGESTYFLSINRNKRSVAIDLKPAEGLEIVRELALRADVVVENFRPGTAERLGLGAEVLRAANPRLIYCSISGFGQKGPWRDRAGYDLAVQGIGGLQALTGDPAGPPTKVGTSIADLVTGLYAVQGILLALHRREQTGRGDTVDVAMLDSVVSLLTYQASAWLNAGKAPRRAGNRHPSIAPYETFRAADGWLNLAIGNDALWRKLCDVVAHPELKDDPRFATNPQRVAHREALLEVVQGILAGRTVAEWMELLDTAGVPCGPILEVEQTLQHEAVLGRDLVVDLPHPTAGTVRTTGVTVKMDEAPGRIRTAPPRLGEHTEAVLTEVLGLTADRLETLRRAGVIA